MTAEIAQALTPLALAIVWAVIALLILVATIFEQGRQDRDLALRDSHIGLALLWPLALVALVLAGAMSLIVNAIYALGRRFRKVGSR